MGAWGIGILQDDTACDHRDDIADAEDLAAELEQRLRRVLAIDPNEYLEYDACFDALVPAAIVDAYVNGTAHDGLEKFRKDHPKAELRALSSLAAAAVGRVLQPNAELHELWAENEGDYPVWKNSLEGLRTRLARIGKDPDRR
jgi:hypothetical protein